LNNRRQSVGPKPDSRPRLEGACCKYLTSCLCLLTPPHPSVTHTHQPDSSPPGLAQWACYKGLSVWVQSMLDPCPKDTYIHTAISVTSPYLYLELFNREPKQTELEHQCLYST